MSTIAASGAALDPGTARIGFIGIGNMGNPMAGHLVKAGWNVRVYDIDRAKVENFAATHGGRAAQSLDEIGRNCNVVITIVLDGHIVEKILLGDEGVLKALAPGSIVIDMSSSSPIGTRALGEKLRQRGMLFMDAPVSGGVKGAVAANLAVMTGGDRELVERCDPVLKAFGKRIHVGSLGSGHAAKALNNYVSAAGLAAAAEALIIGERFGIAPQTLNDVLNSSSGRNNSTENKIKQFVLSKTYGAGFALGLMAKDLGLAMEVADACNVRAELGHACAKLWRDAEAELGGKADHTAIAKFLGDLP
jgi:3-hydroxyisobutyrate dehydrogenase